MKQFFILIFIIISTSLSFAADLPGTKKFTTVIDGVLAFGGGQQTGRSNQNPLQEHALTSLCENGFSESIYLYDHNAIETNVSCGNNSLYYHFLDSRKPIPIIERIHQAASSGKGPVYVHCWNGRHASNAIAAIALRQFCGWSTEDALQYWYDNANGAEPGVEKWSTRRIKNYKLNSKYNSSPARQGCP